MDASDVVAARAFQTVRSRLETGPWNTGELGEKGYVVSEPLGFAKDAATDGIKRYTDRYLSRKTIGRTAKDFPFNPGFLPTELHKPAGLDVKGSAANGKPGPGSTLSHLDRLNQLEGAEAGDVPEGENNDGDDHKDDDDDENNGEAEDEFEEMDDDDYNAEKYFDDGEEFGEGDDGDDEAAY